MGIDYNHEDLKNNIWTNKDEIPDNGIDDDNNGYIDDIHGWNYISDSNDVMDGHGHGTHVSGIIAAEDNDKGIIGAAPKVKIMPLKVGSNDGTIYLNSVEKAIEYGLSKGIKIFNCSFEGSEVSEREYEIIKNSNALFLCAAGLPGGQHRRGVPDPAGHPDPGLQHPAAAGRFHAGRCGEISQ